MSVKPECTPADMERLATLVHHAHMAKQRHFLREWRKHRGYTLEQVAEQLGTTHATLSRIERGKLPFNEPLLDALSEIYSTDRASLIMRDPTSADAIWSLWDTLTPPQRIQAVEVIKAIKRTGTNG